ncbi:hypothetical protein HELRODRAFT_66688 [Helobdella robusta]|uniref:PHD-type domain-containing protein n=1 Tax=Helobdella robusta TaxID=6412 RepID=T1FYP1_HELRO|nr:hypothetical protein HELRODRAFT_66688 [Helobdella robusta]ESN98698.1 hypothetical protein HELRODRAFT_66688 [Helobdella robusta]
MLRSSGDPSDDYCAICNNGGELLCCDGCPKVFHMQCHVSQLTVAPSDKWYCGLCTSDDVLRLNSPEDDATNCSANNVANTNKKRQHKVCERLLLELYCDFESTPFHEPVSKSVPNYHKIISTPMDFRTIRIKLMKNHFEKYQSVESFIKDVLLVFSNCATFNPEDTDIARAGRRLNGKFLKRCSDLLPYLDLNSFGLNPAMTQSTQSANIASTELEETSDNTNDTIEQDAAANANEIVDNTEDNMQEQTEEEDNNEVEEVPAVDDDQPQIKKRKIDGDNEGDDPIDPDCKLIETPKRVDERSDSQLPNISIKIKNIRTTTTSPDRVLCISSGEEDTGRDDEGRRTSASI